MTAPTTPLHRFPWLHRIPRSVYCAAAVLYMGGIYILSGLQISFRDTDYPRLLSFLANLFHFPLYAGLGALLLMGLRRATVRGNVMLENPVLIRAMTVLCCYAAFDETHQSWTGRTPSVLDFLLDALGGLAAILVLKFMLEGQPKRGTFLMLFAGACVLACFIAWLALIP